VAAGPAPRTVVLTFDNLGEAAELEQGTWPADRPLGSHESVTLVLPILLNLLTRLELTATFFVEAINAEAYPNAVLAIASHGHQVGFHAWRHERWGGLDERREADLIERGRAAFDSLGLKVEAFRPPGGELNGGSLRLLSAAGIRWCSPEGNRASVDPDTGIAIVPFRWPLVDATYLHEPFAALRERLGMDPAPLDPGEAEARLWTELEGGREPATIILHPFLAADGQVLAAHARLLTRLADAREAGAVRVVPAPP
jgi:peptidoglycan/xylan/chitin deacetylase (PgdA/CDA1 family)